MNPTIPHIVKAAGSLLLEVEKAVADFPRKHRYSLGTDLRDGAINLVLLGQEASRAGREPNRQRALLRELSRCIDKLKLQILMGHRLQCFSFARCELLTTMAASCGRQCGGWLKAHTIKHPKGQNPAASGR